MARQPPQIELHDDHLHVSYSGADPLLVYRRSLDVPYDSIESIDLGLSELPSVWSVRLGNALPFSDYRRGTFFANGIRQYLDVRDRERVVALHMKPGFDWDLVALQADDPDSVAAHVREHLKHTVR